MEAVASTRTSGDIRGTGTKMTKLETVKIVARVDAYGQSEFDIVTVEGGYLVRGSLGRYDTAREIAERIDAANIYERENGAGSLDTI